MIMLVTVREISSRPLCLKLSKTLTISKLSPRTPNHCYSPKLSRFPNVCRASFLVPLRKPKTSLWKDSRNSSGVMPIIFSTSSLALPATISRFTGVGALKNAAVALNPGDAFYLPTNIVLIAFFNYYYTFLQLDPDEVSEQLKRQGASIPLVRPGKSTAD